MAELMLAMGASAGTATAFGGAAAVLGPVLQVAGALSEMGAAREQAAEHERAGKEAEVSANIQADLQRRRWRQRMAAERGSQIEGGVYSGTAIDLEAQNFLAAEQDALMIEYQGSQSRQSSEFRAAQARRDASPLKIFSTAVSAFSDFDPLNLAEGGGATVRGGVGSRMAPLRPA